jgi:hypothetical protein
MFRVNKSQWDALSEGDRQAFLRWLETEFPKMETHAEIVHLPSGKNMVAYADARAFVIEQKGGAE